MVILDCPVRYGIKSLIEVCNALDGLDMHQLIEHAFLYPTWCTVPSTATICQVFLLVIDPSYLSDHAFGSMTLSNQCCPYRNAITHHVLHEFIHALSIPTFDLMISVLFVKHHGPLRVYRRSSSKVIVQASLLRGKSSCWVVF